MLISAFVFVFGQDRSHQPEPYLLCLFTSAAQPEEAIFAISAPLYPLSRKEWLGAMSRFSTLCRNKADLLYFDQAARA